ncbi:flagellar hook-basal body complex protein FliE [bacterium]|nr:flagellar hook-basal body complex protein FliE [bacterium]
MNIEGVHLLNTLPVAWQETTGVQNLQGESFQQVMLDSIQTINEDQAEVKDNIKLFLKGEGPALHEIMLRAEEAKLSLEFAVQVRNKVMDAYNEIMRMQM